MITIGEFGTLIFITKLTTLYTLHFANNFLTYILKRYNLTLKKIITVIGKSTYEKYKMNFP